MKELRRYIKPADRRLKRLCREMGVWGRLCHPNILPFIGYATIYPDTIYLISPWAPHGHVMEYLEAHPDVDKVALIRGIATGLEYLHLQTPAIIHGDIKGPNVLVGDCGQPLLCDFGLSTFISSMDGDDAMTSASAQLFGSARWKAPERIDPQQFNLRSSTSRSLASDVFSFGMTAFEILSGGTPFKGLLEFGAMNAIVSGERPHIPEEWRDDVALVSVLRVIEGCWSQQPLDRPSAGEVVLQLSTA